MPRDATEKAPRPTRPVDPYAAIPPPSRRSSRIADSSSKKPSAPPVSLSNHSHRPREPRPGPVRRRSSHNHSKDVKPPSPSSKRSHRRDPHGPESGRHHRSHKAEKPRSHDKPRAAPASRKGSAGPDLKNVMDKGKQTWHTVQPVAAPLLAVLAEKYLETQKSAPAATGEAKEK